MKESLMRELPVAAAVRHALRSAFDHLNMSLYISAPWLAILAVVDFFAVAMSNTAKAAPGADNGVAVLVVAGAMALTLIAGSSIAVNWHRFILLDEVPKSSERLRVDRVVWRYFGNTVLIIALAMLAAIPASIVLTLIGGVMGLSQAAATTLVGFAMLAAVMPMIYRWSLKLPAIAIGRDDYDLKQAWNDSRGNHIRLMVIGLGFIAVVLSLGLLIGGLVDALRNVFGIGATFIEVVLQVGMNWIGTIVAATLLTSFYGFFVEKRAF
jgi:hypothetical protein